MATDPALFAAHPLVTRVEMTQSLDQDRHTMKLLPVLWEGHVRKKGDWLPRWDELYVTLDAWWLRLYENKAKYDDALRQDEKAFAVRLPIGSPPHEESGAIPGRSPGAGNESGNGCKTPTRAKGIEKKLYWRVESVVKENAGRQHGFAVTTKEKKTLHLAVESELERIIWMHVLTAVVEQQEQVKKHTDAGTESLEDADGMTLAQAVLGRVLPSGLRTRTVAGMPITVNLSAYYEAWTQIQCRKGNFAEFLPCLHPNVSITSNYPPSVPISGEYHGREGVLLFFMNLHGGMDITLCTIEQIVRSGDLAVVTGWETVKNCENSRKFRHLWKHELRFDADGRISHINILADKTAASVAFGMQTDGAALELPQDQEPSAATCPSGEVRVVCVCGDAIRKKNKQLSASTELRVVMGLNGFPHQTLKAAMPHKSLYQNGTWKVHSTKPCKNGSTRTPLWAETLSFQFSGAVPGTTTCLHVEVWQIGMIGDELIGCAKINLANHLFMSTGSSEDIASSAVPQWYDLRRPDCFDAVSPARKASESNGASDNCGRLQLSISFQPYSDAFDEFEREQVTEDSQVHQHRQSFDRLKALHEEAESLQRHQNEAALLTSEHGATEDIITTSTQVSDDGMHTFTVASTKFRVYTRYQLIRAIGHGAYGVVIAASDQITGNSVAIKNIPKTFDDLVDAKRIVREIRLMRHLNHPNIVAVTDLMRPPSLEAFDDTYIVTDLMETDLHRVVNSPETLSNEHIAYITYQMLCGLRYVHSAHILHRDIKPSNILINRDCLVKICDFGLARGIDAAEGEVPDQQLTEYVVTRWYRAPELLLASKYSTAVDVWSVGCILAEMFTRKPLFPGHDHVHQLHLILQLVGSPNADTLDFVTNAKAKRWMLKQPVFETKSLSTVCPSAPADAIDLLTHLLEFDPRKRISIDEAIAHPFLSSYRQAEMETVVTNPFDFSFEVENGAKKFLDKAALRCLIFEDICHFHPEARAELDQYVVERAENGETPEAHTFL